MFCAISDDRTSGCRKILAESLWEMVARLERRGGIMSDLDGGGCLFGLFDYVKERVKHSSCYCNVHQVR